MEAVRRLEDPQLELILLRACIGVSKLLFALRTSPPESFLDAENIVDSAIRDSLEHIVTGGKGGFGELQFRMAVLPIKMGGLGVLTVSDVKRYAFLASYIQSQQLQHKILGGFRDESNYFLKAKEDFNEFGKVEELLDANIEDVLKKTMKKLAEAYFHITSLSFPNDYSLTIRQRAVFECLKVEHAQDFLYTLPIEGLGQVMSPKEYRAVLSYRLMVPMFLEGSICPACNKVEMDAYGDHALHCKFDPGIKHRHDLVRDGLVDILRRAGIAARKEASVGLMNELNNVLLRLADVLVYNWINGKHTCVDLTCCSPLVGLGNGQFVEGKALKQMVRKKYDKHDKACHDNGFEFLPFGFTTFGSICCEAMELLTRVEKVAYLHLFCTKSTKIFFHRIGFFI